MPAGGPIQGGKLGQWFMQEFDKPDPFRANEVPVDRGFLAPLATYADGKTEAAWPAFPVGAVIDGVRAFGAKGFDTPEAIKHNAGAAFEAGGSLALGGLGVGLAGGLADDAVRVLPKTRSPAPRPAYTPDPQAMTGDIIDSPAEMIRRAQQSPLWPKSWFEDAGGHQGRPQTPENLLDAARYVYRFESQDKWDDAVAQAAGGARPMGNALQDAQAKAFQENPQAWWDSRRTLQEQVEGREGPMSEFDRVWDSVDMPPTSNVVDELLVSGVINDAYLGPARRQSRLLRANAQTGAAIPAGMEASQGQDTDPQARARQILIDQLMDY